MTEHRKDQPDENAERRGSDANRSARPVASQREKLDPAPLDASLEDVANINAPNDTPEDVEYGAQPPG